MYVCGTCGQVYPRQGACAHDGSILERSNDALLGTDIGRYRLARKIGEGGMGRVYLAVQPAIAGRVAIKVLSRDSLDLVDRFFAEARTVNLIKHDSIVKVLDLAQLPDGRPYIMMELVEGETLRALIKRGPLPLGGVIQVMGQVLSAVAAAHAIGVVHRDLKPDNIMVMPNGRAKVLDFGIAKLSPQMGGARTHNGQRIGTPAYMAPEQIRGQPVDARTDIYAAGIVLYEAVTNMRPFPGSNEQMLLRAHLEEAPRPPRELRPAIPEPLELAILQALAKLPGQRFGGAQAMANALAHALPLVPEPERGALVVRDAPSLHQTSHSTAAPPTANDRPARAEATTRDDRQRGSSDTAATTNDWPAPRAPVVDAATRAERPRTPAAPPPALAPRRRVPYALWLYAGGALVTGVVGMIKLFGHGGESGRAHPPAVAPVTPAPPPPPPPSPPPQPAPAPGTAKTLPNGGRELDLPSDYDPKHFDPSAYLARATVIARMVLPDAELTTMSFQRVFADGHVDTTVPSSTAYMFHSPAEARRGGSDVARLCILGVSVRNDFVTALTTPTTACSAPAPHPPACTVAEVWRLAIKRGAPADQPAFITWSGDSWAFQIDAVGHKLVRENFRDTCGQAAAPPAGRGKPPSKEKCDPFGSMHNCMKSPDDVPDMPIDPD